VIEAAMYMALGFCTAGLIGLAILPAFYRRAARLTEEALRAVNPSSYAEVRAAQDQARARHAIELRRVERQLDGERAKAAKHHLEASRLRTEIDDVRRSHLARIADFESQIGALQGDQKAIDLLTAEVKTLKHKLAESEKALAESWKEPVGGKLEVSADEATKDASESDKKSGADSDWMPAADTMALATITGLEAEVATLKSKLAKYDPAIASEIDADPGDDSKTQLADLEAQLVDTEARYVAAQAEVTRLSMMLDSADASDSEREADMAEKLDSLTKENAEQRSQLKKKEQVLKRQTGQLEKLRDDLAGTPALVQLREEFRALAGKLANAESPAAAVKDDTAGEAIELPPETGSNRKKRAQRVVVAPAPLKKPPLVKVKASKSKSNPAADEAASAKSSEIASAAEALVSRIVASNRKKDREENSTAAANGEPANPETSDEPAAKADAKTSKQKKKDVA